VNWNYLRFDHTGVLEAARNQGPDRRGDRPRRVAALTYRPFMSQNVVLRASYARLVPGDGWKDLFPNEDAQTTPCCSTCYPGILMTREQ
jgi:hypothetical protein